MEIARQKSRFLTIKLFGMTNFWRGFDLARGSILKIGQHPRPVAKDATRTGHPVLRRWLPNDLGGFPFFIGARPIDAGDFRSHGAQIDGEFAAVVDAVVVEEGEIHKRRHVESSKEFDRGQ